MKNTVGDFKNLLSPLEYDILKQLWPDKKLKVRQLFEKLKGRRKVALSSIAVLCDRLHQKGILSRRVETARGGARYIYFPKQSRENFESSVIAKAVDNLISEYGSTAVAYFEKRFKRK